MTPRGRAGGNRGATKMSNSRLLLGWLVIPLVVLATSDCDAHDTSRSATKKPAFQGIVTPWDGVRAFNVLGETITLRDGPAHSALASAVVEEKSRPGGGTLVQKHEIE